MISADLSHHKTNVFKRHWVNHAVLRIVLVYVLFSALWILLSDQALAFFVREPGQFAVLSTIKGWLFVAVTAFFLAAMIRRYINQLAMAADQLRASERYLKNVINTVGDPIFVKDDQSKILLANDAFCTLFEMERENLIGKTLAEHVEPHEREHFLSVDRQVVSDGRESSVEETLTYKGKPTLTILTRKTRYTDEKGTHFLVGVIRDISDLKAHQVELEHIAHFDTLTGLPNRLLLADRLHQAISQSQRRNKSLAVAYLDLDNIKSINDSLGHDAGDAVLIAVCEHMKNALREGDSLARMGGDEFVALLVDLPHANDCIPVIERLLQAAATPIQLPADTGGGRRVQVSASIGLTFYPQDEVDPDVLLRHADQAMYQAKQSGKNRYHLFDIAQDAALQGHHEDLKQIQLALQNSEFVLHYQPKVNMRTGEVVGAEALIRWPHPERGLLPPSVFLPIVEGHPSSIALGKWVINNALTQIGAWKNQGLDLAVSVNMDALQLQQHDFPEKLSEILAAHPDVSADRLQLEILETSAIEDTAKVSGTMRTCQALGVTFAIDDFGTGYSSLTYLKNFPAEVLKIDQSFIRNMTEQPDDLAIVKGVIGLAGVFHRQVIAEGVETKVHGDLLLGIGCELAQGYGIARPMPATDIPTWVKHWQAAAQWSA